MVVWLGVPHPRWPHKVRNAKRNDCGSVSKWENIVTSRSQIDQPNILFIFTDQQTASAMSCAGNEDLHTPAMDRLAAQGVRFAHTYCTSPLCSPARSSLFTGRMPHETGVTWNNMRIAEHLHDQTMGNLFSTAGYECAYGGKWHVPESRGVPNGLGFQKICDMNDHQLADRCIAFLEQDHQRPFLLVASFDNPHNICEWARNQLLPWGPVKSAPTADCPTLPANAAIPPFEPEMIRLAQAAEPWVYMGASYSDDEWRHYRHAYYRLVEKVDAEIGRILDALDATGLAENTLVVFTSDHGDGVGTHRWNQKSILYEEVVRVPLVVSFPGTSRTGAVDSTHLVSNGLDLLPTFCDYAGVEQPEGLSGYSLRPLIEGNDTNDWRDHLVIQSVIIPGGRAMTGRAVRTARHKYVVYNWGRHREQLHDLEDDPGEMVNLAVSSRHSDVLQHHRQMLYDWCRQSGDAFAENGMHRGQPSVPGMQYVQE